MIRTTCLAAWALCLAVSAQGDVLDTMKDRGGMTLGVRPDAPPFSYRRSDGTHAGLAVALCRAVARRIGVEIGVPDFAISYLSVNAAERFRALHEGRTDLHCGPATATLSRRETLDFSLLYFVDAASAAVRHNTFDTIFDSPSGAYGVLRGTTTAGVVHDLVQANQRPNPIVHFGSHGEGLRALADGRVDIYFGDQAILFFQIDQLGLHDRLIVMQDALSFEPYALVMQRGETRLRLAVDRALSEIYEDGTIYRMISEALGDYPISPEARVLYQIVGLPR